MNPFKKAIARSYLKLSLKWTGKQKELYDFSEKVSAVKNILLLMSEDQKRQKDIPDFIAALKNLFGTSKVKTFTKSQLNETDLNWMGIPNHSYLSDMQTRHYDLLLDLSSCEDLIYHYIAVNSGALIRMNLCESAYDHIYNLHIRTKPTKLLAEQLVTVISQLQSLMSMKRRR